MKKLFQTCDSYRSRLMGIETSSPIRSDEAYTQMTMFVASLPSS